MLWAPLIFPLIKDHQKCFTDDRPFVPDTIHCLVIEHVSTSAGRGLKLLSITTLTNDM